MKSTQTSAENEGYNPESVHFHVTQLSYFPAESLSHSTTITTLTLAPSYQVAKLERTVPTALLTISQQSLPSNQRTHQKSQHNHPPPPFPPSQRLFFMLNGLRSGKFDTGKHEERQDLLGKGGNGGITEGYERFESSMNGSACALRSWERTCRYGISSTAAPR